MDLDRRDLLRWLGIGGGAAALASCGGAQPAGDDTTTPDATTGAPDADPACRVTTGDAQGPFFVAGAPTRAKLAEDDEPGDRLLLAVEVLAEGCASAVNGALVDVWQADRDGGYHAASKQYRLRGQVVTPADGRFTIDTIRPGNYEQGPGLWRPAHLHFTFSHPDYQPVTTQLYFSGDPYLPPNDSCTSCHSNDTDRVIGLGRDGKGRLIGTWKVVLRRRG